MKTTKKSTQSQIVIGLRRSHIDVVARRPTSDGRNEVVRTRTVKWRHESTTLASELGQAELLAALKPLVAEQRLHGSSVYFSLSGEFCVTRVVTGTADRVRRELVQLEQRSSLYLSLGTGPKALATSIHQVDARHQHALLTVVNQRVLDALVSIAAKVGVKIDLIEPSLVAMSRALGHMQRDHEQPVIIVHLNEQGVELGISHRGQLLLDYRPGGRSAMDEIPAIVVRHLARLERYCKRYFRFGGVAIDRVILSGAAESVALVRQGFEHHCLAVEELDAAQIEPQWQFDEPKPTSEASGAVGTCLLLGDMAAETHGPNLVERARTAADERWLGLLLRTCWPVAAALLVVAGIGLASQFERYRCRQVEHQLTACEEGRQRVLAAQNEIRRADQLIAGLESVAVQLPAPAWHELLQAVAHCLPDDVWLENVAVEASGRLRLNGVSYGEDGVYEFIGWLKKNPRLARIALEETGRATLPTGPATRFGASGSLADYSEVAERAEKTK